MKTMADALTDVRAAVDAMASDLDRVADTWTTPRAPGKWSPSQVTEHVARALDESVHLCRGEPDRFPSLPAPVRFLARTLFFNRVVRSGRIPKARTNPPMNPGSGPASPAEGKARLATALSAFEEQARSLPANARVRSTAFGDISAMDWVIFQAAHTRHHHPQIRRDHA